MNHHYNQLTLAEAERLAILIEECGEVIQVAGKVLRHGWTPVDHNASPPVAYDNRVDLETELGHVRNILNLMCENGDITMDGLVRSAMKKHAKWRPYLHHQP